MVGGGGSEGLGVVCPSPSFVTPTTTQHTPNHTKTHPHAVADELLDGLEHVGGVAGGQRPVEQDDLPVTVLRDGAEGGEGQVEEVLEGRLVCVCVCVVGVGRWLWLIERVAHAYPQPIDHTTHHQITHPHPHVHPPPRAGGPRTPAGAPRGTWGSPRAPSAAPPPRCASRGDPGLFRVWFLWG